MRDLIRFDDAQKAVCDGCSKQFSDEACEPSECLIQEALVHVLPVDAAPVRRGEWVDGMKCQYCEQVDITKPNFCPNCGADMRGAWK